MCMYCRKMSICCQSLQPPHIGLHHTDHSCRFQLYTSLSPFKADLRIDAFHHLYYTLPPTSPPGTIIIPPLSINLSLYPPLYRCIKIYIFSISIFSETGSLSVCATKFPSKIKIKRTLYYSWIHSSLYLYRNCNYMTQ